MHKTLQLSVFADHPISKSTLVLYTQLWEKGNYRELASPQQTQAKLLKLQLKPAKSRWFHLVDKRVFMCAQEGVTDEGKF